MITPFVQERSRWMAGGASGVGRSMIDGRLSLLASVNVLITL